MLPMAQPESLPTVGNKLTNGWTTVRDTIPVRFLVKYSGSHALDKSFPTAGLLLSSRWLKALSNNFPISFLFYLHSVCVHI